MLAPEPSLNWICRTAVCRGAVLCTSFPNAKGVRLGGGEDLPSIQLHYGNALVTGEERLVEQQTTIKSSP